jgi:serine beta-lactamase-like protein LACTB, mitochondrial
MTLAPNRQIFGIFLLCASSIVEAAPPPAPTAIAAIETEISSLMSERRIPGLSIAVVMDNQLRWADGYGMADVENSVPARSSTVFRIASVTKPVTAVAALQLVERGKLDLDAAIQTYVPTFPEKSGPITARLLLGHLAGIRNYLRSDFSGQPENARYYSRLTDALEIFRNDPLDAEPGTRYSYTTFGYALLGVAIEGASGQTYGDYMRENVFGPAHMLQTRTDSVYDIIPNRARGYTRLGVGESFSGRFPTGDVRNSDFMDSSYKLPGGGLVSTVEDLAAFAIAVQSGVLVAPETFERMVTRQRTTAGEDTPYGLGWYVDGIEGRTGVVWHGGVQKGVTSTLYLLPRERFAVVILTNLEGGGMLGLEPLASRIADILVPSRP